MHSAPRSLCVCVCVYIRVCVYIHTHIHTHSNITSHKPHSHTCQLIHTLTYLLEEFCLLGHGIPVQLLVWVGSWNLVYQTNWVEKHKMRRLCRDLYVINSTHETAICHNPQNSWSWNSLFTRQLGYKHTFCQNVVSTKIIVHPYIFIKM